MDSAGLTASRGSPLAHILLGTWAAAIAVVPGLPAKLLLAAPAVMIPLVWWTLATPARWLTLFLAVALLTPPLPVPIGDSGPHVCLLVAALGLFAGLLWLPAWRFTPSSLASAFVALCGALLISVAPAALHSGALAAVASLARVALFGISVYIFFYASCGPARRSSVSLRGLYWMAVAAALFACVDFYFQFPTPAGYGPQFVWLDSGVYRRAQGLFYEASTLGNFCAFFLVMIAVAFTRPQSESPVSRPALVVGGAVFSTAMVLSYSRASLLCVVVALAVLAWRNRRRLPLGRLIITVSLTALLVWRVFPAFTEIYWARLSNSAEFLFTATEGVLSGRVASWRTLLDWMAANPWQTLLGIGYKTLPYTNYLGGPVVADNMYLSLLAETGIAGLAALIWLNVAILRAAARAARSANGRAAFCGSWMLCFWCGQVIQMLSGDLLTYWRVLPVYFLVLALAVRV